MRSNLTYHIAVDGFGGAAGTALLTYAFTPVTIYHVTVNSTAGGFVTPASADVQSNGTLIVTATPNPYFQFDSWDGAVVSSSNPLSVVVNSNLSLTAHFVGVVFTDDFESGDLQHIAWTTNGPAVGAKPWFVQTNVVAAGQFAARSGFITQNQTSSLLFTGTFRAGNGSFDYRVSSELNFDTLKFLVDGVQQQQWSGDVPWANFALPLTAGTHTLEWRYSKDANGNFGLDAAFIDNVNLPLGVGIDRYFRRAPPDRASKQRDLPHQSIGPDQPAICSPGLHQSVQQLAESLHQHRRQRRDPVHRTGRHEQFSPVLSRGSFSLSGRPGRAGSRALSPALL